jgi:hypothetical protein
VRLAPFDRQPDIPHGRENLLVTRVLKSLIVLAALCLLAAPIAHASYRDVIKDCAEDGVLDKKYSDAELTKAKKKLPADVNEYSDCREVIAAAIGGAGKHSGGKGGGTTPGAPPSAGQAKDQSALNGLVKGGAKKPKVKVGDHLLEPGKNGLFRPASARNDLPLPLLLALIAIGLVALGGALYALRRRIPALAKIPLPRVSLPRRVSLSRNRD